MRLHVFTYSFPVKAFLLNLPKLPYRHKGDWFILFPFHVNSIASGFRHVEIGAVEKVVTVVHYKPSTQKKDQFQEIFMEYERKNLCCDDGFLIIFCHDRYYKVHFCSYQIIINIRVIVVLQFTCPAHNTRLRCLSIHVLDSAVAHPMKSVLIIIPRLWFTKLHTKSSSLGDFT